MSGTKRELVRHSFLGGRFSDHGLELDSVTELAAYRQILIETAKELWRKEHPNRERLPRNFESKFRLKFYEIQEGSTVIPIVREVPSGFLPNYVDELDRSVDLVSQAITAVNTGSSLPANFPRSVLPFFDSYGKTLRKGESFGLSNSVSGYQASYSRKSRELLTSWDSSSYENCFDFTGEVVMVRVDRAKKMALALENGTSVELPFPEQQESVVLEALTGHESAKMRVTGSGEFDSSGILQRIVRLTTMELLPQGVIEYKPEVKPIWQRVAELNKGIPPEEFDKLPKDFSVNHNHYLYGNKDKQ